MTNTGEVWRLGRRPALDGLRGVAALVVLIGHCVLTDPARGALQSGEASPTTAVEWILVASPLRLTWAGDAAVAVFFVLSGYVLARPFLHGTRPDWGRYYPRRLVRLYLPVWGALAFAALLVALIPRATGTGYGWIDAAGAPLSFAGLMGDATLTAPDQFLGQLWSLHWEVLFSLLLPAYLPAARWLARFGSLSFVPLVGVVGVGWATGVHALMFLPVFACGAVLAAIEARDHRPQPVWQVWVVAVVAVAAMTAKAYPVMVLGAVAAVAVVLAGGKVTRLLSGRVPLWLGKVSYSLYLVHLPIVLAVAPLGVPLWATLVLAVPTSLATAAVFHRLVEAPSQRLAARGVSRCRRTVAAAAGLALGSASSKPSPEPTPARL